MALARGPAVDYDAWAELVRNNAWRWENILPRMKDLEDFDPQLPPGFEGYARPSPWLHGKGGPLGIGFGQEMVPGVETFFQACLAAGIPVCVDNNSGNPVGVGLAQFNVCMERGRCGQNMLDHSILTLEYEVDNRIPAHNQIFLDPDLLVAAEAQYAHNQSGPLAMYGSSGSVAFPKIPSMYDSKEFQDLDAATKEFLLEPTRPSAEIWLGSGPAAYAGPVGPGDSYITHEMLLQNNLSRGSVTIASRDPRALPVIDPNFLSQPCDERIAIACVPRHYPQDVHGPGGIDFFSDKADSIFDGTLSSRDIRTSICADRPSALRDAIMTSGIGTLFPSGNPSQRALALAALLIGRPGACRERRRAASLHGQP
ncbi:hypothetical protein BDV12DRAFT_205074 [Aspergillus spectabilis]